MYNPQEPKTRDEVMSEFGRLLEDHERNEQRVDTRAQVAARDEAKQVVERAATYSVEGLVKELTELQLRFGSTLDELADMLSSENMKLDELKQSIVVESAHLDELGNVKIAAEALQILTADQQVRRADFDQECEDLRKVLIDEIEDVRQGWVKQQQDFEEKITKDQQDLEKTRAQEEADYAYKLERDDKIAGDAYETRKRTLERELDELKDELERNWTERESVLAEKADEIARFEARVESFPKELEEKVNKSREDAIKKASAEAKLQAELMTRQYGADEQVHELRIESMQAKIEDQTVQIAELERQLDAASARAQELAMRAVEGTARR